MRPHDPPDDGGGPVDPPSGPPHIITLDLEITTPTAGTTVEGGSGGVTIAVAGTASCSGGGSIQAVDVKFGDADFAPVGVAGPSFSSWSATKLATAAGGMRIVVRARHSSGLERQAEVDVVVKITEAPPTPDTTPPSVAITSPVAGRPIVTGLGHEVPVTVTGTAGDAGGSGLQSVELRVDGSPVAPVPDGGWSRWKADVMLTGLGTHAIEATARDGAGLATSCSVLVELVEQPVKPPIAERLMLVEKLRLSSYLGVYGAGRTVKTVSLLPGQKMSLTTSNYKRTTETSTEASSMLDSYTKESEDDFQRTLTTEQSNKQASDESLKWNVDGHAEASWGFGKASLNAGASGGTNASREELSKSVANAVQKHTAKAASKRDVEIKTSDERREETGEELSSDTQIENINRSRTLTFTFRQMNQEFITLLHMTDVRIAYVRIDEVDGSLFTLTAGGTPADRFCLKLGDAVSEPIPVGATATEVQAALVAFAGTTLGNVSVIELPGGAYSIQLDPDDVQLMAVAVDTTGGTRPRVELVRERTWATYQEITLSQLGGLLERVIVPERIAEVRDEILGVLANVFDHEDEVHSMVERKALLDADGAELPNASYLRVPKGKVSTYTDAATGTSIKVPGVILAAMRTVMPTDGVMCEALMGQVDALDEYSKGLQDAAVETRQLENALTAAEGDRLRLGIKLVRQGDDAAVARYAKAFPATSAKEPALAVLNGSPAVS